VQNVGIASAILPQAKGAKLNLEAKALQVGVYIITNDLGTTYQISGVHTSEN